MRRSLEAFEQIRTNFQEVFEELFGGGETELRLTDESDVLEAGIDIIACPPGKRPQSITQLSRRRAVACCHCSTLCRVQD